MVSSVLHVAVKQQILRFQSPTTGLFPADLSQANSCEAHVRDSIYCAVAVWSLAQAYKYEWSLRLIPSAQFFCDGFWLWTRKNYRKCKFVVLFGGVPLLLICTLSGVQGCQSPTQRPGIIVQSCILRPERIIGHRMGVGFFGWLPDTLHLNSYM